MPEVNHVVGLRVRRGSRTKVIIEEQAAKIWAETLGPFAGYLFGNNNILNNSQYVSDKIKY